MELQQQKELKKKEMVQENQLREKEISQRGLKAELNHRVRMFELELEREGIELRKREINLLEKRWKSVHIHRN